MRITTQVNGEHHEVISLHSPIKVRTLSRFEERIAAERVADDEVLRLLNYPTYFDLLKRPLPENRYGILNALCNDALIRRSNPSGWTVTNLGAVLFAKRLADFRSLRRKAMRVIQYRGNSRIEAVRERVCEEGYASGFESLIGFIDGLLPSRESIEHGIRTATPSFPEPAIRELVANALVHQDFFTTGMGPMVEIFEGRIEITNPGPPLVDARRFVDSPPKSRNESLASLMRRLGICEQRGTGWDKVVFQSELFQLPAPRIDTGSHYTRVLLFGHRALSSTDRKERIRALYLHACYKYVNGAYLTNSSVCQRFGIEARNSAKASQLITEAVEAGAIVADSPNAARNIMQYLPWWARGGE